MPPTRVTTRGAGWLIALATFVVMLASEPWLAIVWDEGYTLGREARLRLWFRALADPAGFAATWTPPAEELVQQVGAPPPRREQVDSRARLLFDPVVLAWFWPFGREEPHGHPPFYALVGLAGDVLTPWRPPLARARLGPMLAFSLAAGAIFGFVARRWGPWAGAVAAGAWVSQPNLFGHGHYATYDALLSALWVGTVLAFGLAVDEGDASEGKQPGPVSLLPRWRWVVVFGLLCGCAADTKLTGWFLPLPFLVWVGLYRSRRGLATLLIGGLIGVVVLYVLNPPWWAEPIAGPVRFLASNLRRDETIRIKTLFLGQVISTPDGSLPWFNTLVWTVLVTPVGYLLLALVGVGRAVRRSVTEPFGILAVGHWAFLLALRALPHTPGHDGVRQFLPAFGMLSLVAGLGTASLVARCGRWGRVLAGTALAEGALSVALMGTVPLSYYSPLVGGLPGASALGMEPTYYWDALGADTLDWLASHTPPGRKVAFATFPTSWLYLRSQHRLPQGLLPTDAGTWAWYVVQNRPGAFSPLDRVLVEHGQPAWVVRKWGVPLLWVFPFDQVEAVRRPAPGRAGLRSGSDPLRMKTPTTQPARGERIVGLNSSVRLRRSADSLTRGVNLGRGQDLRGAVDDGAARGRGRLAANRGRGATDPLVAQATQLDLGEVAACEQAALPGGRLTANRGGRRARRRNRLAADRGGRRARHRSRLAADGGRRRTLVRATQLVTGPSIAGQQHAQDADQSQGQQMPSHGVISGTLNSTVKIHRFHHPESLGRVYARSRIRVEDNRAIASFFCNSGGKPCEGKTGGVNVRLRSLTRQGEGFIRARHLTGARS